jgi:hypothetical protein
VEEYLRPLRRSLIARTLVGAGVTLLLLGGAFAYVLMLVQRTRRLETEAQMSERRAHVATLAREMAHEIRNPLNAMSINLEMLEEELAGKPSGNPDEVKNFLKSIKGEIRRLKDLTENFLSYARPPQLNMDANDLNRFLEEICVFVQPEAEARRILLVRDLDPLLPSVDFDSAQLRQAVLRARLLALLPQTGLVVDLRGNPGGLVWAAERMLQLFTDTPIAPTRFSLVASPLTREMANSPFNRLELEQVPAERALEPGERRLGSLRGPS